MTVGAAYIENDPFAAQWLRELIKNKQIADGEVLEQSIEDVRPRDLVRFTQVHLFAGVGIWSLAARLAGWPDDRPLWSASCPCPPFSSAGKTKSCPGCGSQVLIPCPSRTGYFICCLCDHAWLADGRHLWPEVWRLMRDCRPHVCLGEQVAAADGRIWVDLVRSSVEVMDYAFGVLDTSAAVRGAPHIRQRLYWGAVDNTNGGRHRFKNLALRAGRRVAGEGRAADGARLLANDDGLGQTADGRDAGQVSSLQEAQRESEHRAVVSGRGGGASGLANDTEQGRIARRRLGEQGDGRDAPRFEPGRLRDDSQLGDTKRNRLRISGRPDADLVDQSGDRPLSGLVRGRWSGADWIFCRDGKWRPAQSASQQVADGDSALLVHSGLSDREAAEALKSMRFPLAVGEKNRIGRLRGYGNALCAPVAQGFIEAVMDVLDEGSPDTAT